MNTVAENQKREGSLLGATLLVSGTTIGAAVLANPVLTAMAGFVPSVVVYLICWFFMAATGLLFVELSLWLGQDSNMISMASRILGPVGKVCTWVVYLYLFYSLTVAYISGSGDALSQLTNGFIQPWLGTLLFTVIFSPWVYFGARAVDRTNELLMIGLGVTYLAFVVLGGPQIRLDLLNRIHWGAMWIGLPVILTSFGFQGIVPSLTTYLNENPRRVRTAILAGSFLPLVGYVIWQALILGTVPLGGEHGLRAAMLAGRSAVAPLRYVLATPWVFGIAEFFAFFALTSSFLGVTLGLRDFLADGMKIAKTRINRAWICGLIFIPALLISWSNPNLFLLALRYGGGVGAILILGLLPVVLVWVGRYRKKMDGPYQVFGGRWLLGFLGMGFLVALVAALFRWV